MTSRTASCTIEQYRRCSTLGPSVPSAPCRLKRLIADGRVLRQFIPKVYKKQYAQTAVTFGRSSSVFGTSHRWGRMAILRMDNVAIVVADLDSAVAFFAELGMELEGRSPVAGLWADRTVGLDGVRSEIAMMRTPDGHSKIELTNYDAPAALDRGLESPPPNTIGLHRVMFTVDDIDDTITRLRTHGAQLLGEVAQYDNLFRLCYLRGPAGIIVALAEQIG